MDRRNSHAKLSKNKIEKSPDQYPIVFVDKDADFTSIKIQPGLEAKSYLKNGVLISEDKEGHVIEIQILNVSGFNSQQSA